MALSGVVSSLIWMFALIPGAFWGRIWPLILLLGDACFYFCGRFAARFDKRSVSEAGALSEIELGCPRGSSSASEHVTASIIVPLAQATGWNLQCRRDEEADDAADWQSVRSASADSGCESSSARNSFFSACSHDDQELRRASEVEHAFEVSLEEIHRQAFEVSSQMARTEVAPQRLVPRALVSRAGPREENGFVVAPDVETIRTTPENIAPFSIPEEVLSFRAAPEVIILNFRNGDSERMIHCNTLLSKQELEQLSELQRLAASHGISFPPSVSVLATRFISDARGDINKALANMISTVAWREEYFATGPVLDTSILEHLRSEKIKRILDIRT